MSLPTFILVEASYVIPPIFFKSICKPPTKRFPDVNQCAKSVHVFFFFNFWLPRVFVAVAGFLYLWPAGAMFWLWLLTVVASVVADHCL